MYQKLEICPISNSDDKITYFNLGMMPLVNNLCSTKEESLNCQKFPLELNYYKKSSLSMLSIAVDPLVLFHNYLYKSGVNVPYVEHYKSMYSYISKFVKISNGDQFIDIGGNDGMLLKTFKNINSSIKELNIDPSVNITQISRDSGIKALTSMWTLEVSKKIPKCKVITSTNVFQHVNDIKSFVMGINNALSDDGIWCLEFPYWKHDLETNQYDQIYHEHIYYYLLSPIYKLFNDEGLEIIDVSEHEVYGGTMRIISRKNRNSPHNEGVLRYLDAESKFRKVQYYQSWGEKIKNHIADSKKYVSDLKKSGKKIAGFGAAAKGCVFLNSCKFNYKIVDYVVDDTDIKQGKFIPGTGIEIVNRDRLVGDPPDYIIILAHNFSDYIMKSLKPIYKGKFIVMFPDIICYE